LLEWNLHTRMNLFVVLWNRLDKAIPTWFTLLELACFLDETLLLWVWSSVHVLAHECSMLSFTECFWINLGPQEWNLSWCLHSLLDIIHNSMFIGFILIKNERCSVHWTAKLGLCFEWLHGTATPVWSKSRSLSCWHLILVWKSCYWALWSVLSEELGVCQCRVVKLIMVVLWTIKEFAVGRM